MRSKIHARDAVDNQRRKFGAATRYYPARLRGWGGDRAALFTPNEINVAMKRALDNPEDVPPLDWWERVCAWFKGVA